MWISAVLVEMQRQYWPATLFSSATTMELPNVQRSSFQSKNAARPAVARKRVARRIHGAERRYRASFAVCQNVRSIRTIALWFAACHPLPGRRAGGGRSLAVLGQGATGSARGSRAEA